MHTKVECASEEKFTCEEKGIKKTGVCLKRGRSVVYAKRKEEDSLESSKTIPYKTL